MRVMWEVVSPVYDQPPKPLNCVDGWSSHEWQLSIEEGQPTLSTDCNLCEEGVNGIHGIERGLYEMPPITVRIEMQVDLGHPYYGIDPYWWLDITPVTP